MAAPSPSVFVSGCFDLLHAGHVEFLSSAARIGRLTVALGSDRTIAGLKGKEPLIREAERLRIVRALSMVDGAFVSSGSGVLDFAVDLRELRPDVFVVNEDGHAACKEALCRELGIEYVVLRREPPAGLPAQSSSKLRGKTSLPYRVDLAGGWLDQPFVSSMGSGPVIVASIEPNHDFDKQSGMATSTRETARKLWGDRLPWADPVQTAKLLFGAENPPGKQPVAGSQDALGIALPGVSRLDYEGGYWPSKVETIVDDALLSWLEPLLWLYPLRRRATDFDVFAGRDITRAKAGRLAHAAERAWQAITTKDTDALGQAVSDSFEAQISMFPAMMTPNVEQAYREVRPRVLGAKLTGAGGGGYLLLISRDPPPGCRDLHIRHQIF